MIVETATSAIEIATSLGPGSPSFVANELSIHLWIGAQWHRYCLCKQGMIQIFKCSLFILLTILGLKTHAAKIREVNNCESLLQARRIGFNRLAARYLPEEWIIDRRRLSRDWIGFGFQGPFVNLTTLNMSNKRPSDEQNIGGYEVEMRSPSQKFAIALESRNPLLSPVMIANLETQKKNQITLDERFIGLLARVATMAFSEQEDILAIDRRLRNHISLVDTATGQSRRLDVFGYTRSMAWSKLLKRSLIILSENEEGQFKLVRHNVDSGTTETIFEGSADRKSTAALYIQGQAKIMLLSQYKGVSHIFLINENDGSGEVVRLRRKLNLLSISPNGKYALVSNSKNGLLLYSTQSLASSGEVVSNKNDIVAGMFNSNSQLVIIHSDGSIYLNEIEK